jgi:diguanylate cyclase (GGDEF)-like protein
MPMIYGSFLLCTAAKWSLLNGFGFQYLWPNSVFWHNEGFHILYLLFAILGLQFSKAFLKTGKFFPNTHKLFIALQASAVVGIVLRFAGFYEPILHFSFAMLAVLAVVIPIISLRAWMRGVDYPRWYLFAWLVYSFSLLIALISAYSNWLNWGMQSLTYLQIGSLLEAIFLTIAMTERLMSLDKDRRKAIALAHQDPLTGLGNRRLLQMKYEAFRDQFAVDRTPVFLIMIDLDHFKRVNDQYGHEAGDHILKEFGQLLRDLSRSSDVCVRYGGEEFAILLHADSITTAHQIGERIRKRFAETPTAYQDHKIWHTLSMGITPVLSGEEMLSVEEMMARADAALYESKASGRNRAIVHSDAQPISGEPG